MVGREITPTEIGKHSKLIKNAQDEMATIDVLVCGRCLTVFHFVEEFRQHKLKPCFKENNNVRECNDTKPKIWAFLLWKATQISNNKDNNITSPNSWALYQTWVKMEETLRETWIVAGRTIQSFAKVSQGSLQEMPVKITKTVVNNLVDNSSPGRKPLAQTKPQVANLKPPNKVIPSSNNSIADSENEASPVKSPLVSNNLQKVIKKPVSTPQLPTNKPLTSTPANTTTKPLTRRAKRSIPNSEDIVEENVEKIVAKRFNPRRRMHEYLVKWENRSLEQNTWEPASHLEDVPHLLETFEKQLARQKETRAAMQAKQQAAAAAASANVSKPLEVNKTLETEPNKPQLASPSERPQRSSKTKAMDQVKQWVAGTNSSDANSPSSELTQHQENEKDWSMNSSTASNRPVSTIKRKLDDTDYNDSTASNIPPTTTTNTMEDFEENLIPLNTLKKMKYGNAVSVEVKTKLDNNKEIKVNGTVTGRTEGHSNSAEVIITQDSNASGVVKKPGFNGSNMNQKSEAQIRVLTKGESAVSNSGIVRLGSVPEVSAVSSPAPQTIAVTEARQHIQTRTQHVRTVSTPLGGRSTPVQSNRHIVQQQIVRTPSGTTIQRKTVPVGASAPVQRSAIQSRSVTQTSPSSGRMIIPRQGSSGMPNNNQRVVQQSKAVTPEQKNFTAFEVWRFKSY